MIVHSTLLLLLFVAAVNSEELSIARQYVAANRADLAEKIFQDQLEKETLPEERAVAQYNLATAYAMQGKLLEADQLFSQIADEVISSKQLQQDLILNRSLTSLRLARAKLRVPMQPKQELIAEVTQRIDDAEKNAKLLTNPSILVDDILLTKRSLSSFESNPLSDATTAQEILQVYLQLLQNSENLFQTYLKAHTNDPIYVAAYRSQLLKKMPKNVIFKTARSQLIRAKNTKEILQAIENLLFYVTIELGKLQNHDEVKIALSLLKDTQARFNASQGDLQKDLKDFWSEILKTRSQQTENIIAAKLKSLSDNTTDEKIEKKILEQLQQKLKNTASLDLLSYYSAIKMPIKEQFRALYLQPASNEVSFVALTDLLAIEYEMHGDVRYKEASSLFADKSYSQEALFNAWYLLFPQDALHALIKEVGAHPNQKSEAQLVQILGSSSDPLIQEFAKVLSNVNSSTPSSGVLQNLLEALSQELYFQEAASASKLLDMLSSALSFERQAAHYAMQLKADPLAITLLQQATLQNLKAIYNTLQKSNYPKEDLQSLSDAYQVVQGLNQDPKSNQAAHDLVADLLEKLKAAVQKEEQNEPTMQEEQVVQVLEPIRQDVAQRELIEMNTLDHDDMQIKGSATETFKEVVRPW